MKIQGFNDNKTRAAQFMSDLKARNLGNASHDVFSQSIVGEINRMLMGNPVNLTYAAVLFEHPELYLPFAQAVDMQKILDSNPSAQVVLFGEDHVKNQTTLPSLAGQLPLLKKAGFCKFGFEAVQVDEQELIDDIAKGLPGAEGRLLELFKHEWGFMSYSAKEYLMLMKAAMQNSLGVAGLSHPKPLEQVDSSLERVLALHFRDCFMCLAINATIKEQEKMLVLVGSAHIEVKSAMPRVLKKEFEMDSIAVMFFEHQDVKSPFMVKYSEEVAKLIPVFKNRDHWKASDPLPQIADWIIFLPGADG